MSLELTPLEVATHTVFGIDPTVEVPRRGPRPRERLEEILAEALSRPPCGVAFSGGCDSSVLLALATTVARREGLEDPVAVTGVFPGLEEADESQWQRLVVEHLGIRNWERMEIVQEQSLLSPHAVHALRHLGLHFTPTLYQFLPYMERVRGGSLITGVDGDTVFEHAWRRRRREALWGLRPMKPQDVPWLALYAAPHLLRQARYFKLLAPEEDFPWLRPAAARRFRWQMAGHHAGQPLAWQPRTRWVAALRQYTHIVTNAGALARSVSCRALFPFLDAGFLGALGASTGPMGYSDRGDALVALFGDLLPERLLRRSDKAHFTRAVWTEREREFVRGWNGTGVDHSIVDADRLVAMWQEEEPFAGSAMLLHQAWLASGAEHA